MPAPSFPGGEPRAEPTLIDAIRDTSAMVTNRVKIDAKDTLVLIEPESAPFMTLSRTMKTPRTVTQHQFEHFEKDPQPRLATVGSAVTSGATTVNVTTGHGARFRASQLVQHVKSREVFRVTSVSTDALTVVRQYGGTGPASFAVGDNLVIMGEARESGTTLGGIVSTKEVRVYNETQIFSKAIGWEDRLLNTALYGGKDKMSERRAQAIEIRKEIEFSAFFGVRDSKTGTNSRLITTTGGLEFFANKNVWDLQGNEPNEQQFVEWLEWSMREGDGGSTHGKGVKWLFAADRLLTIIEKWARDRVEYVNPLGLSSTSTGDMARKLNVGLKVGKFTTTHGTIMLVKTPIFRMGNPDRSVLVDMEHIKPVRHQGRDLRLLENQEANDEDAEKEQWFGDLGWEITNAEAHSWIVNAPY
jgi:hypothetical protein